MRMRATVEKKKQQSSLTANNSTSLRIYIRLRFLLTTNNNDQKNANKVKNDVGNDVGQT